MRRALAAEAIGTGLLLFVIVGSGIAAASLSADPGLRLLAHALAVGLGLGVLIALFQPVSGSHFNPAVTLAFWRSGTTGSAEAVGYTVCQIGGAVIGVVLANLSFGESAVAISTTVRSGSGLLVAEAVGTFVLVFLILALVRTERAGLVPVAVGAWVAAIIFATSSTGFANPAVTIARMFTDTYTGIAPASVAPFLAVQLVAGLVAVPVARLLFPIRQTTPVNA